MGEREHELGLGALRLVTHDDCPGWIAVSMSGGRPTGPWFPSNPGHLEWLRAYLYDTGIVRDHYGLGVEEYRRRVDAKLAELTSAGD